MTPRPGRPDRGDRAGRGSGNPPPPILEPPTAPVKTGWREREMSGRMIEGATVALILALIALCTYIVLTRGGVW